MTSDLAVEELFAIEGIMVAGRPGQIRLLVDQAVVDLDENDIVSADELPGQPGLVDKLAQPVRLVLRRGASLLDVGAAKAYDNVVWERGELFALRTRKNQPEWRMSEEFQEMERRFFANYGIEINSEEEDARS